MHYPLPAHISYNLTTSVLLLLELHLHVISLSLQQGENTGIQQRFNFYLQNVQQKITFNKSSVSESNKGIQTPQRNLTRSRRCDKDSTT